MGMEHQGVKVVTIVIQKKKANVINIAIKKNNKLID